MKKYYKVQKVSWDQLWHVWYVMDGRETYDRVTHSEAYEISKHLIFR